MKKLLLLLIVLGFAGGLPTASAQDLSATRSTLSKGTERAKRRVPHRPARAKHPSNEGQRTQGTPNLTSIDDGLGIDGTYITFEAAITNDGSGEAGAFYVGVYLSTNDVISTEDYLVGSIDVGDGLLAGETVAVAWEGDLLDLDEPLPAGTYYVGYIIDDEDEVSEGNEEDNSFVWPDPAFWVTVPGALPNLYAAQHNLRVSGTEVTVELTVRNEGAGPAGPFYVGYYLSRNNTLSPADFLAASTNVEGGLQAGASLPISVTFDLATLDPSPGPGEYFVGYIIDDDQEVPEWDEGDNGKLWNEWWNKVTVPTPLPNLASVGGGVDANETSLGMIATITNEGPGVAGAHYLGFYLSTNSTISPSDHLIGFADVGGLTPGATCTKQLLLDLADIDLPPGEYYAGYIIDDQDEVTEWREEDNTVVFTSSADRVVLLEQREEGVDLLPAAATVTAEGVLLHYNTTITNAGTQAAGTFNIGYYLSDNETISVADVLVAETQLAELAPGSSFSQSFSIDVMAQGLNLPPGNYYAGVLVDDGDQVVEYDESNNGFLGDEAFNLPSAKPDLVLASALLDVQGHTANIEATVGNVGYQHTPDFSLGFYLSENATLSTADLPLGTVDVSGLGAGNSVTVSLTSHVLETYPDLAPGTYYFGLIADVGEEVDEYDETDNSFVWTAAGDLLSVEGDTRILTLGGVLDFGTLLVNDSLNRTLIIGNAGNTPLTIEGVEVEAPFRVKDTTATIGPGLHMEVPVFFAADVAGVFSGSITVHSNATGGIPTQEVRATTVAEPLRKLVLSGDLHFGEVLVNDGASRVLLLANEGNIPLDIDSLILPAGFTGDWGGGVLFANESRVVTVSFAPGNTGFFGGDIAVVSDADEGMDSWPCTGYGIMANSRVVSLAADLDFGDVELGTTQTLQLMVKNEGTDTLEVFGVALPTGYVAGRESFKIGPGDSAAIPVSFSPTEQGLYHGSAALNTNATSGTNAVGIFGMGVQVTGLGNAWMGRLEAYPNPTYGQLPLQVELEDDKNGVVLLQVYNLSGQLLLSQQAEKQTHQLHVPVEVGLLPQGMYLLRVLHNQEQHTLRFTKQ